VNTGKYIKDALREGSRPSKKAPNRYVNSYSQSLCLCRIVKKIREGGSKHTVTERMIVEAVANRSPALLV